MRYNMAKEEGLLHMISTTRSMALGCSTHTICRGNVQRENNILREERI